MDYIHLNEMLFYGYHGALKEENVLGQRFQATVSLAMDLQNAGETDQLNETVNYAEVYEVCKQVIEGQPVQLIETLAERIAQIVLTKFHTKVQGVRIRLVKPDPPIAGHYHSVAVEITRGEFG